MRLQYVRILYGVWRNILAKAATFDNCGIVKESVKCRWVLSVVFFFHFFLCLLLLFVRQGVFTDTSTISCNTACTCALRKYWLLWHAGYVLIMYLVVLTEPMNQRIFAELLEGGGLREAFSAKERANVFCFVFLDAHTGGRNCCSPPPKLRRLRPRLRCNDVYVSGDNDVYVCACEHPI